MRKPKRNPKIRVEYIRLADEPTDAIITDIKKTLGLLDAPKQLYYGSALLEGTGRRFAFHGYGLDEMDVLKRTKPSALTLYKTQHKLNRYDCKK